MRPPFPTPLFAAFLLLSAPPRETYANAHAAEPEHPAAAPTGSGSGPGGTAKESIPGKPPKPDTVFAGALDWNDGDAEILSYTVKRTGRTGEAECRGRLVTERMFLHPDGSAGRKSAGKDDVEILNAVLGSSGELDGSPFSEETVVKFPRKGPFTLLRQDQSLQGWPGSTQRALDCRVSPPRLRVLSSGDAPALDTVLSRWPVYTEEMLFTYLRTVPQRAGYREEVWLHDWGGEGRMPLLPHFAILSVHSRTSAVRETETWYMTVDREDGRRSEFWISTEGLHPVVMAILLDHSAWTLQDISRARYWPW